MAVMIFVFASFALIGAVTGQNQVPPGLRKPPFIVVPPENERLSGAASEPVGVVAGPPPPVSIPRESAQQSFSRDPPPQIALFEQPAKSRPVAHSGQTKPGALSPEVVRHIEQKLDGSCLSCICKASTNCEKRDCTLTGPNQYFCGPYHISWAYWADSGKPGDRDGDPLAFERCLKDVSCSEQSILGYMTKFGKDCNGDGTIDCKDFARIHKAGANECNSSWLKGTEYWRRFISCWNGNEDIDLRSGNFGLGK